MGRFKDMGSGAGVAPYVLLPIDKILSGLLRREYPGAGKICLQSPGDYEMFL